MSEKVFVAGVGMIPFSEARREPSYTRDGRRGRAPGAGRCRHRLRQGAAGLRRLRLRRLHLRPDGAVRGGHDRHPRRQRQQQLLDRLDRAVPARARRSQSGAGRMRAGAGLRADAAGRAEVALERPSAARASASSRVLRRPDRRHRAICRRRCASSAAPAASTCRSTARSMETFATIRAKASRHAANNPLALFRKVVTTEDVMDDKVMWPGVMTRLMACPPTCGAAAAIVVLRERSRRSTACAPTCRSSRRR